MATMFSAEVRISYDKTIESMANFEKHLKSQVKYLDDVQKAIDKNGTSVNAYVTAIEKETKAAKKRRMAYEEYARDLKKLTNERNRQENGALRLINAYDKETAAVFKQKKELKLLNFYIKENIITKKYGVELEKKIKAQNDTTIKALHTLAMKYNATYAASENYNKALKELFKAQSLGAISADQLETKVKLLNEQYERGGKSHKQYRSELKQTIQASRDLRSSYDLEYSKMLQNRDIRKQLIQSMADLDQRRKAGLIGARQYKEMSDLIARAMKQEGINVKDLIAADKERATYLENTRQKYNSLYSATKTYHASVKEITVMAKALNLSDKERILMLKQQKTILDQAVEANNKLTQSYKYQAVAVNDLKAKHIPLYAEIQKYKQQKVDLKQLLDQGDISQKRYNETLARYRKELTATVKVLRDSNDAKAKEKKELHNLAMQYDTVYAAQHRYKKAKEALQKLLDKNVISLSSYNKMLAVHKRTLDAVSGSGHGLINRLKQVSKSFREVGYAASISKGYVDILHKAWKLFFAISAAKTVANWATSFAKTGENIELMARKLEYFTGQSNSLQVIAQSAYKVGLDFEILNKTLTRFAIVTKGAFKTEEMVKWTESLVKSARIVGTTNQELHSGLLQLSQAMSAGRLMGDEYRSISENLPMLKLAIEDVFADMGHGQVALKELSRQGKITSQVLIDAFNKLGLEVDKMGTVWDTIDAALSRINGEYQLLVYQMTQGNSVFKDFLNSIAAGLKNLRTALFGELKNSAGEVMTTVGQLNEHVKETNSKIDKLSSLTDTATNSVNSLVNAVTGSSTAVASVNEELEKTNFWMDALVNTMAVLLPLFGVGLAVKFLKFAGSIMGINTALKGFGKAAKLFTYGANGLKVAFLGLANIAGKFFGTIKVGGLALKASLGTLGVYAAMLAYPIAAIVREVNRAKVVHKEFEYTIKSTEDQIASLQERYNKLDFDETYGELERQAQIYSTSSIHVRELSDRISELYKEMEASPEKAKALSNEMQILANAMNLLQAKANSAKNAMTVLNDRVKEIQTDFPEAKAQAQELLDSLFMKGTDTQKAFAKLAEYNLGLFNLKRSFDLIRASIRGMTDEQKKIIDQMESEAIQRYANGFDETKNKINKVSEAAKTAKKVIDALNSTGDSHILNIQKAEKAYKLGHLTQKQFLAYKKMELKLTKEVIKAKKLEEAQIRSLTKSRKELAKYVNDANEEIASINAEDAIGPDLISDIDKYNESLGKLALEYSTVHKNSVEYKAQVDELTEAHEKLVKVKTDKYYKDLAKSFDHVAQASEDYEKNVEGLQAVYTKGYITTQVYNRSLNRTRKEFIETAAAAGDFFAVIEQSAYDFSESVFDNFHDTFREALDDNEDAWDNFTERLENSFKDMLANMLRQAILNPIMVSIQGGIGGMFGAPTASGATGGTGGIGGSGGSGFSMSSISNLFGGNSLATTGNQLWNTAQGFMNPTAMGPAAPIFGGSNLAIGGAGILGGIGADMLYGGKGYSSMGGGLGASLGYSLGAGSTALTSLLGSAGWAAGPIGAVAGMVLGGALGSVFGGSDSDVTPDLNLATVSGGTGRIGDGYKMITTGAEENGTFDPQASYGGRFGRFSFGTQHDAFSSEADAINFAKGVTSKYAALEEAIYQTFGKETSEKIAEAMQDIGEYSKFEDFAGADDFKAGFRAIFSEVFRAVGDVVSEDYEKVFFDFLSTTDSLEVAVGAVAAVKDLSDNTNLRPLEDFGIIINAFVKEASGAEEQMKELVAATQLLKLEDSSKDFKKFLESIWVLHSEGDFSLTAQEVLTLGTNLLLVNQVMEDTNLQAFDLSLTGAELVEELIRISGGLEAFAAKTAYYYENFFSNNEKMQNVLDRTAISISEFNEKWDTGIFKPSELRKTIEGLGKITDENVEFYNALLSLAPTLVDNNSAAKELGLAHEDLSDGIEEGAEAVDKFKQSMEDLVAELNGENDLENATRRLQRYGEQLEGISDSANIDSSGTGGIGAIANEIGKKIASGVEQSSAIGVAGQMVGEQIASGAVNSYAIGVAGEMVGQQIATGIPLAVSNSGAVGAIANEVGKAVSSVMSNLTGSTKDLPKTAKGFAKFIESLDLTNSTVIQSEEAIQGYAKALLDLQKIYEKFEEDQKELYKSLIDESDLSKSIRGIQEVYKEFGYVGSHASATTYDLSKFVASLDVTSIYAENSLESMKKLGSSMKDFEKIVDELDQTITDSIEALYGDTGQADKLALEIEQKQAIADAAQDAYELDLERYEAAVDANEKILDMLDDMKISDLNPQSQFDQMMEAKKLFESGVSSGDADKATEYGQSYLEFAKAYYASTPDYAAIFYDVESQLESMVKNNLVEPIDPGEDPSIKILQAQLDAINDQKSIDEKILERQLTSETLIDSLMSMSLATDTTLLALAEENNLDFAKLSEDLNKGLDGFYLELAKYAGENELTTYKLAEILGIDNQIVEDYFKSFGVTQQEILDYNASTWALNKEINKLTKTGFDQLNESTLQVAGINKWSTEELAEALNITNQEVVDYLLRMNVTQDQINAYNAQVSSASSESKSILQSIDNGVLSVNDTLINSESAQAALDIGYGGLFTDNQILQLIGEYTVYNNGVLKSIELYASRIAYATNRSANNLSALNSSAGITAYETGTKYVPNDGPAFLHEGEMVIDRKTSNQLRRYGVSSTVQDNSELLEELRMLREEVKSLKTINAYGFKETIRTGQAQAQAQQEIAENERMK